MAAAQSPVSRYVPWVLPWDDAAASSLSVPAWLERPWLKDGKIVRLTVGPDGHLSADGRRARLFGVNLCFGACFPEKVDSEKIASRMAKFGINCVRFHHMDNRRFPDGILDPAFPDSRHLSPEALDRLDYLIFCLTQHGIYANINLLVSRKFTSRDGLPASIDGLDWKDSHIPGFFLPEHLSLQKEYARELLTHRNPYTGLTFAEDPAVAIVEINNENGLLCAWYSGGLDRVPEELKRPLADRWNRWLMQRYRDTAGLEKAWKTLSASAGEELLKNGNFADGQQSWTFERHSGAEASFSASGGIATVQVTKPGTASWHVQMTQRGIAVQAGAPYTLSFVARADREQTITVLLSQARAPWRNLGFSETVAVGPTPKRFTFVFAPSESEVESRLVFSGMGTQQASYSFSSVSLASGGRIGLGEQERVEDRSVALFSRGARGRTQEAVSDWMEFLAEVEDTYWAQMYRFLKEDLGVKGLVVGTAAAFSTVSAMAKLDAVDTHSYWQHPSFPGRPWDPVVWNVGNKTMVNENGGTLPGIFFRRAAGKPHLCTEYNHPAPNTFSAEAFLLLAAYAALQDTDGIFAFTYSHRTSAWDQRKIPNFFDIDQHPGKMATFPAAAALFLRADVSPAREELRISLARREELDARYGKGRGQISALTKGVPPEICLVHRVALEIDGKPAQTGEIPAVSSREIVSDTGQLRWTKDEKGRGMVTCFSPRSRMVVGYCGGKTVDLGGIRCSVGSTMQDGWVVIALTCLEGAFDRGRLLITCLGSCENTEMGWKNPERTTVGKDWGKPPSLVEAVAVGMTVPSAGARVWALDEKGQRKGELTVSRAGTGSSFTLSPEWNTVWYEVELP